MKPGAMMMAYCLRCCAPGSPLGDVIHIFSTPEKRQAWADRDERSHVFYDYLVDHPERFEEPLAS